MKGTVAITEWNDRIVAKRFEKKLDEAIEWVSKIWKRDCLSEKNVRHSFYTIHDVKLINWRYHTTKNTHYVQFKNILCKYFTL